MSVCIFCFCFGKGATVCVFDFHILLLQYTLLYIILFILFKSDFVDIFMCSSLFLFSFDDEQVCSILLYEGGMFEELYGSTYLILTKPCLWMVNILKSKEVFSYFSKPKWLPLKMLGIFGWQRIRSHFLIMCHKSALKSSPIS